MHLLLRCRFFVPLWRGVCLCLSASQLTKVRSHAAAALEAMLELLGSLPPARILSESSPSLYTQQLHCARCVAPLLKEAWEALAAAAEETGTKEPSHSGRCIGCCSLSFLSAFHRCSIASTQQRHVHAWE